MKSVCRLAANVEAGIICGTALVVAAQTQVAGDPEALNAELIRLYRVGKYVGGSLTPSRG